VNRLTDFVDQAAQPGLRFRLEFEVVEAKARDRDQLEADQATAVFPLLDEAAPDQGAEQPVHGHLVEAHARTDLHGAQALCLVGQQFEQVQCPVDGLEAAIRHGMRLSRPGRGPERSLG